MHFVPLSFQNFKMWETIVQVIIVVTYIIAVDGKTSDHHCSLDKRCTCHQLPNGGIRADCSGKGLFYVPSFNGNVLVINLNHNNIRTFKENASFPKSLLVLSLSHNLLDNFSNDPFHGLFHLKSLDLSNNKLKYHPTVCVKGLFRDLTNLQTLNIKRNANFEDSDFANITMYPLVITELMSLRKLLLDGIDKATFAPPFRNLSFLRTMDLSGGVKNKRCRINSIEAGLFSNVPLIENLYLQSCYLQRIENGLLRQLQCLQHLDLSRNSFLSFKYFETISYDLQFTRIKTLNLKCVHCSTGIGTIVLKKDLQYLRNTSLEMIILSYNRIQMFEDKALLEFPKSLKEIDLSNNILEPAFYVLELFTLANIQVINVNNQKSVSSCGGLYYLNCHDWRPCSNIPITWKMQNYTNEVVFNLGRNIRKLFFRNIGLQTFPDDRENIIIFPENNSLEIIDLSSNRVGGMTSSLVNLEKLNYMNLSNNEMMNISTELLKRLPNLLTLDLSKNFLGLPISADTGGSILDQQNLKTLNISHNGIGHLPTKLFQGLKKIEILIIRANALSSFNAEVGHLKSLKYLDLSQNKLIYLKASTISDINSILKHSNITINLSGNILQCECGTLAFLIWMRNNVRVFSHFEEYTCDYIQKQSKFKDLNEIIQDLEKKCSNYDDLIAGVLTVVLLSFVIIFIGIVYRYRWKLRYIYYATKQRYKDDTEPKTPSVYQYDAFVSYANEDRVFVERLADTLEHQFQSKLIMHEKDFIAGKPVAENITEAVHKSRKTVIVLSSSFLKSYWCMFEFQMARMESIYSRDGEEVLFILMLERLRPRSIPLMIMDVIESDSYIEYPRESDNEELFWIRLHQAISAN